MTYETDLEDGRQFEDYVAYQLWQAGIPLINHTSKVVQFQIGENMLGMEIKYNPAKEKHKTVFIEYAERCKDDVYRGSGFLKGDNSWLLAVGDMKQFFVFSVNTLRKHYNAGKNLDLKYGNNGNTMGMILQLSEATRMCLLEFTLDTERSVWSTNIVKVTKKRYPPLRNKGNRKPEFIL